MDALIYRFKQVLRQGGMFWGLVFPILLGTLYHFAFSGLSGTGDFDPVDVAVVKEEENETFADVLDSLDGETLTLHDMEEDEALEALGNGDVAGIYYEKEDPSLTLGSNGIDQTILSLILQEYDQYLYSFDEINKEHPERLQAFSDALFSDIQTVEDVTLGGKSYDNMMEYYFALIGMACLFGCFTGMTMAGQSAANVSPLAARRSVSPVSKLSMVLTDLLVGFLTQWACVILLLLYLRFAMNVDMSAHFGGMVLIGAAGSLFGVSFGMFIGSLTLSEGQKSGLLVLISLLLSFLAGLMYGGMKQVIEYSVPVINRINPAALISDALYYLNIYDDPGRYAARLLLLVLWSAVMTTAAFLRLRKSRYESL